MFVVITMHYDYDDRFEDARSSFYRHPMSERKHGARCVLFTTFEDIRQAEGWCLLSNFS